MRKSSKRGEAGEGVIGIDSYCQKGANEGKVIRKSERIETEITVGVPRCRRNTEKQKLGNEKRREGRRKQKYYSRKAE